MRRGKKYSKEIKKNRLRNKKLVKKYPWLKPRNVWTGKLVKDYDYSWIEWGCLPGWDVAFGDMYLKELGEAVKDQKDFMILEIKEKYGCYDDKTEVLTKRGWKFFKDLSYEDQIATLNPISNYLEYEHPSEIIAAHYNGKMYHLENRGISLCVTPNHNLYVAKGSDFRGVKGNFSKHTYDFELCQPDKYFGKDKRFLKTCKWDGKLLSETYKIKGIEYDSARRKDDPNSTMRHYINSDMSFDLIPWLRFLGFYIAEGCVSKRRNKVRYGEIMIAFNPADEAPLVQSLLCDIGVSASFDYKRGNARFNNPTLGLWLLEHCGYMAYNKKVPQFIKDLPPFYIEEFLKYLFIGDGHKTKTSNILTTTSKQLSNDVQELLLKAGYSFRERIKDQRGRFGGYSEYGGKLHAIISKHMVYNINWLRLPDIEIDMSKARTTSSFKEEWIPYSGCVYCVTVPNHIIYVRRNGKGIWCGNSHRCYPNGTTREAFDIIAKYEFISQGICYQCGKPDVPMVNAGWICPECFDCFKKRMRGEHSKYQNATEEEIRKLYDELADEPNEDGTWRIPDVRKVKHWDSEHDEPYIVEYDISNTVKAIRDRYQKRRDHYVKRIHRSRHTS